MAYTEFCCRSGGSNLNAGTLLGDGTEPGTSPSFSYAGTFSGNTFTVSSGNPQSDGVIAGMFVHVSDGTNVGRIARITSVTSTTIVLSATATVGSGTGATQAKVGGAWAGPAAALGFPIGTISTALVNAAGELPRINLKNDQSYLPTATITQNQAGLTIQGYASAYGDGGRAVIDAGGNTIVPLTISSSTDAIDLRITNNGASGANAGIAVSGGGFVRLRRLVVDTIRGAGISGGTTGGLELYECEIYDCNRANTSSSGGLLISSGTLSVSHCAIHDNAGSNNNGIVLSAFGCSIISSIIESNGASGIVASSSGIWIIGCDFYDNARDGIEGSSVTASLSVLNSNFVKNGRYGAEQASSATRNWLMINCGYGSGTMANTSGAKSGAAIQEAGAVTYPANVTPWADPANGDFRIVRPEARGTGRGSFMQTAAGYAGTVAYPDIGAAAARPLAARIIEGARA